MVVHCTNSKAGPILRIHNACRAWHSLIALTWKFSPMVVGKHPINSSWEGKVCKKLLCRWQCAWLRICNGYEYREQQIRVPVSPWATVASLAWQQITKQQWSVHLDKMASLDQVLWSSTVPLFPNLCPSLAPPPKSPDVSPPAAGNSALGLSHPNLPHRVLPPWINRKAGKSWAPWKKAMIQISVIDNFTRDEIPQDCPVFRPCEPTVHFTLKAPKVFRNIWQVHRPTGDPID